jgi:hypothetical protein
MAVQPNTDPKDPRPPGTSPARIWSPFVIGSVGGTLAILFESQIGESLGVYSPLFGYLQADIYAGAVIGLIAALVSRTWTGLLTLMLGLATVGPVLSLLTIVSGGPAPGNLVPVALYLAFWLGFFGVPTYAGITGIYYLIRKIARAARPPVDAA